MTPSEKTCKAGYTAVALERGYVQTVGTGSIVITLHRSLAQSESNTPFHIIVMKNGKQEFGQRHHWIADARQTFTRQIRYHLGEHLNDMVRDKRFTCEREWSGQPHKVWVCRFCGEFYSYGITKAEALMIAWEKKYAVKE